MDRFKYLGNQWQSSITPSSYTVSYFDREIFFPDDDDNKRVLYVGMMGFRLAFQSIQQTPFERSEA